MKYREKGPRAELDAFINCFWMIEGIPGCFHDRTLPDGCQEMVFHIDSVVRRSDKLDQNFSLNPSAELVGQMTKPYDIVTTGSQIYFGIKFFPHSFSAFTGESVYDLRDQSIDLYYLMPKDFGNVIDRLYCQPTFENFIDYMESYFLKVLTNEKWRTTSYYAVTRAVQTLLTKKEAARIDNLHKQLGVSQRYLQNSFKHHVGLTPKQLFRMIRFQKTFQYLHDRTLLLTEIALRCGYYDHAHFTREFSQFVGVSPSAYKNLDYPFNQFFLNQSSRAYLCNFKD